MTYFSSLKNESEIIYRKIITYLSSVENVTYFSKLFIIVSLIIGFFTRIVAVFWYIQFGSDQAGFATAVLNTWEGIFPFYGPAASLGGYGIPGWYYYINFLFTFFGPDPVWQAFSNAVFSFGSIIVLMVLIYRFFNQAPHHLRLWWASIGGLWWSVSYFDIYFANIGWNPNSIPFFLLFFLLSGERLNSLSISNNRLKYIGFSLLYGFLAVILMSLHTTTLFVIPIFFITNLIWFTLIKRSIQPLLWSLLSFFAALSPFIFSEIKTNYSQLRQLWSTIRYTQGLWPMTHLERLSTVTNIHDAIINRGYFLISGFDFWISFIMLSSAFIFILYSKGNSFIKYSFLGILVLFMVSISRFKGELWNQYIILPILYPLLFTIGSLGTLSFKDRLQRIYSLLLIGGIVISMILNIQHSAHFLALKFGTSRIANVQDINKALKSVPSNSELCVNSEVRDKSAYAFIDKYLVKKQLTFSDNCQESQYFVHEVFFCPEQSKVNNPLFLCYKSESLQLQPNPYNGSEVIYQTNVVTIQKIQ